MKKFRITYDHTVYKPASICRYKKQKEFELILSVNDKIEACETVRKEHNINPFYLKFEEI